MTGEALLSCFAVTAPGLEPFCATELRALGLPATQESGGVSFSGTLSDLYTANLWLRTASRVLVRVANFEARAFYELELRAKRIPWHEYLAPGRAVTMRVSSQRSQLYHTGAIKERLLSALARTTPGIRDLNPTDEDHEGSASQLFLARFVADRCTLSVDASGALLHMRGYRQATAKAPLRETLAAAVLLASGWDKRAPLLDPLCGSGTIVLEAALLARNIAPGLAYPEHPRAFAFQEWANYKPDLWATLCERARAAQNLSAQPLLLGSDHMMGAIQAAQSNAARAGLAGLVSFTQCAVSEVAPPPGPGFLVSNPPYGVRVGERGALQGLYRDLSRLARHKLPGWTLALLSADPRVEADLGKRGQEALRTSNGGIPVRLVLYPAKS